MLHDPKKEAEIKNRIHRGKASEILLLAADILESRGWCRYEFENIERNVCVRGAINVAAFGTPWPEQISGTTEERMAAKITAVKSLEKFLNGAGSFEWNDTMAASKAEVVDVLRATAHGLANDC